MRYLIDATLLIDHANGRPGAVALVRELFSEPNDLLVCDAVVSEALAGGDDYSGDLRHANVRTDAARVGRVHGGAC